MSEYQPANENKRRPRKKAHELPADSRHHQGNLAPHPGGFDATYQRDWPGQGFNSVALLQNQAQICALPRYAANETSSGSYSGPTTCEGPSVFSQQTFPHQNESNSFCGPAFDNFNHVQQQAAPWGNKVWNNVSNDWDLLVQSLGMEMTESSSNGISVPRDQQVDETELDFDNSYFGPNHDAGPLPVSPSANDPCTAAQTLEPEWDMEWICDPRLSDVLPSSENSMSLPSFGRQDMDFDYVDLAQDSGVMSMPQGSEPWSVANTRGNGCDPIFVGPAAAHHIDPMDFPASFQSSGCPSTHSQDMDDGSSTHNTIPPVSETTFDEFNAEIDEMISSLSTIKDTSADQQASRNSMANNEGVALGRLYSGQGRQQVPKIRFWIRTDTPSRMLGARQAQDTVVAIEAERNLPVPEPSDVSSRSSHLSPIGPASPMSVTSSSAPDTLNCGAPRCSATFSGTYRRGNLGRHRRLKHSGNVIGFPCEDPLCPRVFQRKDARLKHHRKHHPSLATIFIPRGPNSGSSDRT